MEDGELNVVATLHELGSKLLLAFGLWVEGVTLVVFFFHSTFVYGESICIIGITFELLGLIVAVVAISSVINPISEKS